MTNNEIPRRFFQFDRWLGAAPVGSGNINDTFRIDFERNGVQETWLLQRLNHLVFRDPDAVMRNTVAVCEHLSERDFPYKIAMPQKALDGQYLQHDEQGNCWRVFPFFENTFAPEGVADAHVAYEGARAYGAFARALRDFPPERLRETIPGFHDTDRRWQVFLEVLEKNPVNRAEVSTPEIEAMLAAKPIFEKISRLKRSGALPLRVTHNDTKAGNVLLDLTLRKAVAVIDLDTVMPGTLLSDFGDMVRTFVPTGREDGPEPVSLRLDILDALQHGFLEETFDFLLPAEKENLPLGAAWIAGEQALRFLTDWLAGDVYYKIRWPEHNLVRARNQLDLFKELRRVEV